MKYSSFTLAFASLASLATAAPSKSLGRHADICGDTDTIPTGMYTVNNNLWNVGAANPGGRQCSAIDGLAGDTLAWHTSWTWDGNPGSVKSYANAELNFTPKPLSQIAKIPSTWQYTMTPGTYVADISYDIFTDASPANTGSGDHHDFEIMIWLADLGAANPIADKYHANGKPVMAATRIQLAGSSWSLAKGTSHAQGGGEVYSFIPDSQITAFKGDLMDFFHYLQQNQQLDFNQNLVYVAAGTEPFIGDNAVLTTSAFSVAVN